MILFDFNYNTDISSWNTVNDVVMGGNSKSSITLNNQGFGVFSGFVSLENNGGFAMARCFFELKKVNNFTKVCLNVKGDGKNYQFRIKSNANEKHWYTAHFKAHTSWSSIEIPFNTMKAVFRGTTLPIPFYPGQQIEQIAFLIGNKCNEFFNLEIASIILK